MKVENPRNLNIYIFFIRYTVVTKGKPIQEFQFTRISVMDDGKTNGPTHTRYFAKQSESS